MDGDRDDCSGSFRRRPHRFKNPHVFPLAPVAASNVSSLCLTAPVPATQTDPDNVSWDAQRLSCCLTVAAAAVVLRHWPVLMARFALL